MTKASDTGSVALFLHEQKKQVDRYLLRLYRAVQKDLPQKLNDAERQTLLSGGKRLRPILAIAAFRLFSDDAPLILGPAAALELIHTGSLMLDDLPCMDNASLRRGLPTSHTLHGESTTILASAALWVKAFDILSKTGSPRLHELVSLTARYIGEEGLILGQYVDLFELGPDATLPALERSYELKTATLFRLAVAYGAILGDASDSDSRLLDEFARHLGIAFQVRDDIIDVTQSEAESGKDAHKDAQNNKSNYVSVLGLPAAQEELTRHIAAAQEALAALKQDTTLLEGIAAKLLHT